MVRRQLKQRVGQFPRATVLPVDISKLGFEEHRLGVLGRPFLQLFELLPRFHRLMKARLRTPAQGADTIVWLAACPRLAGESGRFWFDRQPVGTHLVPWTRETPAERRALLELLERQTRPRRGRRAATA